MPHIVGSCAARTACRRPLCRAPLLESRAALLLFRSALSSRHVRHPCRLHAVVQFRGIDGVAFVLDPGSTHGTFLNKKRIPAGKHVQLR